MYALAFIRILVVLLAVAQVSHTKSLSDNDINESVNSQLVETILSYMDPAQNPCENFYEYACGNWEAAHLTAGPLNYVDTIGSLDYQAQHEIADILGRRIASKKTERNEVYRKVRDLYEGCLAEQKEGFNVNTYMAVLQQQYGLEWPANLDEAESSWQASKFRVFKTLGVLRSFGLNNVLLAEELRFKNASIAIIELDKPFQVQWGRYGESYMGKLTKSSSTKDIAMARELQRFHEKLKTLVESSNGGQAKYEISIGDLQRRLRMSSELEDYFGEFLQKPLDSEDTHIIVSNIAYLRKLKDLIAKTSAETLAVYLKVQLLSHLYEEMPNGDEAQDCIEPLQRHMTLALTHIYEKEIYQHERHTSDEVIKRIFSRLKEKFAEILNEHGNDLRPDELGFLRRKISEMSVNIGNLPQNVGDSYFADYYAGLEVQKGYFYWSHLNAMRHMVAREHSQLTPAKSRSDSSFLLWPHASPAYSQTRNLLVIPFAYLRQPIFHRDYHELFLFAELGNTLGHEIVHGFDTTGINYDSLGNPDELLANTLNERDHFKRSLQCLRREATHNLDEKMADFSGFRLAFESHFHRPNVDKFRLPASSAATATAAPIELTNKQLFFVKFAQFFCAVPQNRIVYDQSHDTPFSRVPQVVWNYEEFAKEFNCHAQMKSPKAMRWQRGGDTCHVW